MNLNDTLEELLRRKKEIEEMQAELNKKVNDFHAYSQKTFKIQPSNQPLSMADIVQVIAECLALKDGKNGKN